MANSPRLPYRLDSLLKTGLFLWVVSIQLSCSPTRRITKELTTQSIYTDHFTGVALYDPARKQMLVQYNADKPFTPASNTKLFSFYAGLLSLPDSLPAFRYSIRKNALQGDSLIFWGTGNPLLLHPDLPDTTLLAFLRKRPERLFFSSANYTGPRFGAGWSWDDYNDDYSAELSSLPLFGNVVRFNGKQVSPARFADSIQVAADGGLGIRRAEFTNQFSRSEGSSVKKQDIPFRWSPELAARLLSDTLHRSIAVVNIPLTTDARLIRGTATDSLYKRMLHVSDNQFAEQILFMISAERLTINLEPQRELKRVADSLRYSSMSAKWVDGSGLSRYNLFTPNVLIDLLKKIADRLPQSRLFTLLPAAGQSGTLRSITSSNKPYIFAKSGSMSGVYNLSGYVLTKKNKLLYFSIMHNNFMQPVSEMRRRTTELLKLIHERL